MLFRNEDNAMVDLKNPHTGLQYAFGLNLNAAFTRFKLALFNLKQLDLLIHEWVFGLAFELALWFRLVLVSTEFGPGPMAQACRFQT